MPSLAHDRAQRLHHCHIKHPNGIALQRRRFRPRCEVLPASLALLYWEFLLPSVYLTTFKARQYRQSGSGFLCLSRSNTTDCMEDLIFELETCCEHFAQRIQIGMQFFTIDITGHIRKIINEHKQDMCQFGDLSIQALALIFNRLATLTTIYDALVDFEVHKGGVVGKDFTKALNIRVCLLVTHGDASETTVSRQ